MLFIVENNSNSVVVTIKGKSANELDMAVPVFTKHCQLGGYGVELHAKDCPNNKQIITVDTRYPAMEDMTDIFHDMVDELNYDEWDTYELTFKLYDSDTDTELWELYW